MKTNKNRILLATLLCATLPSLAFGEAYQCDGECQDGQPAPRPTATPVGAAPTPVPTPAPTPVPLNSGAAADETSADSRFVTVELQTQHPNYTARNFAANDLSLNVLAHYNARMTTFRGFYVGSNRGGQANPPPSTVPITAPTQLTQAPTPAPTATPTPTPLPGEKPKKIRKKKTAKQFADEGNDNNCENCTGNNVRPRNN
jgi:hypothetical protein